MKRIVLGALCAAVLVAAAPASAQKLSLAERVAALEQKSAAASQGSSQANIDLLNKITQLQGEIQALRSQVEQLQNENEQLKQRSREQYLDLDSRLQRLEGGAPASAPTRSAAPAASNPSAVTPAAPARSPSNPRAVSAISWKPIRRPRWRRTRGTGSAKAITSRRTTTSPWNRSNACCSSSPIRARPPTRC